MYGRAMSPPEEGHQRHIVQHVNALRTLGTPMVSPSPSCGNPPNGTSDVAICPAAMSKNSRVGRPLQHRRTSRVRFAPYPYPDLPPIPSTTGDLLGMILREDMSLDAKEDKAEAAQSWLLQSTKRYGTPTAGYSPPSPMEENLDLSSSQSTPRPIIPTHTPFLTPPTTPSSALTDIEGFSEDEAEVLAEIKENVHSLISPKSARIGLSYLPPTPPHTPESTRSRPLPAHVPNRPNFRTPRSPSFTVEEDCFYGRGPPARWLLPDLAATREGKSGPQTTRQQTINQPPCVAAAPLLALDRSDIAPIGLAMRKGDYRSLARRIKTTSNECQDLTAVSIMPHSPKKQVKRLQGAKMYQEDGKCRQFKHLLAQQGTVHLPRVSLILTRRSSLALSYGRSCSVLKHREFRQVCTALQRTIYESCSLRLGRSTSRRKPVSSWRWNESRSLVSRFWSSSMSCFPFRPGTERSLGGDDTCHSRNDKLRIANLISQLLNNTADVTLAIETTVSCKELFSIHPNIQSRCRGSHNSTTLAGLSELIRMVDMPGRIKVCIDLCHISQQYDFCDHKGRVAFLNDVEELGFRNVAAIHASNNYYERGQGKSRHAW